MSIINLHARRAPLNLYLSLYLLLPQCLIEKYSSDRCALYIGSGYMSGSQTASYVGYPCGTTAGRIAYITCRPAVVPDG